MRRIAIPAKSSTALANIKPPNMPLLIESVNKPAVEKVAPLTPIRVNESPGFDFVFILG